MPDAATAASIDHELETPYELPRGAVEAYQRDGFIHLRDVLSAATLARFESVFTALVAPKANHLPMEQRNTYSRAFLQVVNLWENDAAAKRFVFCARLARIAAALMRVRGVRMYHDQALYKEAQGGYTPWHCDQQYWPLGNDNSITAWIPLQDTPIEMAPLAYAAGSHRFTGGRHLPISDESEEFLAQALAGYPHIEEPFRLGDVGFHSGWTYHRARGNTTGLCRKVMTIIFMDVDMRLAQPSTPAQENDRHAFAPGLAVGEIMATAKTPVIWQA